MNRRLMTLSALAATLALAGCVGDTDPATNVTSKTAQLNAHGRTNDGPAHWWWEYSTSKSTVESNGGTEVCGSPPEADGRCGPAQSPAGRDIALNFRLTGLTPSTTYWFRACGQDVNDAGPSCGRVLSFTTLAEYYAFSGKVGTSGAALGQFRIPLGLAIGADASGTTRLKVADLGNSRLSLLALEPLEVLSTFSDDLFPQYLARDHLDNIFLTDSNRVLVFDRANNRIGAWGSLGSGDGQFLRALGIAVQREASGPFSVRRVYVVDSRNNRIQKFDANGGFVAKWGSAGNGPGQFNEPIGIGVRGNVYVADTFNDRIQVFAQNGTYLSQWNVPGPVGIAFDPSGNLFVTSNTDEVRKYTAAGALITRWGSFGTANGQFNGPAGIAVDSAGDVYVADSENNRVQKFKKE